MESILCATDFSFNAMNAAEYACAMASKFNARLILLHAYEATISKGKQGSASEVKRSAAKSLEALKNKLEHLYPNVRLENSLVAGEGSKKIVELANREDADVIVMGTTGNSQLERLLMGSTTSNVLTHADCPVFCIPESAKFKDIKRIVFATDLKEDNVSSAMTITPFARAFDAELVFLFVDDKRHLHSEDVINAMTKKIRSHVNYPKISGFISSHSSVTKGIDYFLKEMPADLLVLFTHLGKVPETLFSHSVTRMISHQARIPMLAFKSTGRPIR